MKAEYSKAVLHVNANPSLTDIERVNAVAAVLERDFHFQACAECDDHGEYYITLATNCYTVAEMKEAYADAKQTLKDEAAKIEPQQQCLDLVEFYNIEYAATGDSVAEQIEDVCNYVSCTSFDAYSDDTFKEPRSDYYQLRGHKCSDGYFVSLYCHRKTGLYAFGVPAEKWYK